MSRNVSEVLKRHRTGAPFTVATIDIDAQDVFHWVRLRSDPTQFTASVFDGDWALPDRHPEPGEVRVLRVLDGPDGVSRAIIRQGRHLYAHPWIS